MTVRRFISVVLVIGGGVAIPAAAVASNTGTVTPNAAQRRAILKAFGAKRASWRCLNVRLAASDHRYATVRFVRSRSCRRWAFNGTNIIRGSRGNHWKVLFEGSAYACPLPKIPRPVQRDLGVCA